MFFFSLFMLTKGKDHERGQSIVHGSPYLEEHAEEEDDPVEERGEVLVQGPPLQGGVVGGEAPRQTSRGKCFIYN